MLYTLIDCQNAVSPIVLVVVLLNILAGIRFGRTMALSSSFKKNSIWKCADETRNKNNWYLLHQTSSLFVSLKQTTISSVTCSDYWGIADLYKKIWKQNGILVIMCSCWHNFLLLVVANHLFAQEIVSNIKISTHSDKIILETKKCGDKTPLAGSHNVPLLYFVG